MSMTTRCRVCEGTVNEFVDFGSQPLSDGFVTADRVDDEFFYRLAVGMCQSCTMVQLMDEVPRERMFHRDYPYLSSGSAFMREHFSALADRLRTIELAGPDPFLVELGCNDGVLLDSVARAGIRQLGVEPSGGVADIAAEKGVSVREDFFDHRVAAEIRAQHGPADVIVAANTLCHIPYIGSILRGVADLLAPTGVFLFEDPYFADILRQVSFDQIYDEHFFLFTVRSVRNMAQQHGLELVDVEWLPVHGGELRYTLALPGSRAPAPAVDTALEREDAQRITSPEVLAGFAGAVRQNRADLVDLLHRLRDGNKRVVGYGATAKSATVLNYCGVGPELVPFVCDTSPTKQGRLTPGSHIPIRPPEEFARPYPDYALLFAWNHAAEIIGNEQRFRSAGGQWIHYVPEVTIT